MWLWLEAAAIAIVYATLGSSPRLRQLAIVIPAHAVIAMLAWWIAGGPGGVTALLAARVVFAAQALLAWGLAAALTRACREPGLSAAIAALVLLALVFAPTLGEAIGIATSTPAAVRSVSYAASPPFAASIALGVDVLHTRVVYGRFPATEMEMHMTSWIWTAGAFVLCGAMLALAASLRGMPRKALLVTLVLALGVGCKKKEDKAPAPTPTTPAPTATTTAPADAAAPVEKAPPSAAEIDAAIKRGTDFLTKARGADGWIGGHPGVTAMAALAMATAGVPKDDPGLAPLLDGLAKLAKPDGSIWDKDNAVYVTAISTLAFHTAGVHPELIKKAQGWLAGKQFGEKANKVAADNINYGGVGYGVDPKEPDADLSNLHFALDAIKDSKIANRAEVLARAQKFVSRCQNRSESNDQKWSGNDGGFVYKPGASKAGGTASSGSMTYAGIASFLYTQADANDPRVKAALDYVSAHFSVDENPGLGLKGLFYNYHMMARALGLVGQRNIVDAQGKSHDWPVELATKLLSTQKPDGSWANTDPTYWENNPGIATSRAVLALAYARNAMK
jgi:squalene-hopene/tetraprenyl-beta-curcumene cyclase